jgi:hypothetical protein
MGVHTRVGLGAGAVGFALLYLGQLQSGLGGLALLTLVALLAGLGVAKWLPRSWYGRQLEAGARAGAIACGLAASGLLLSLSLAGIHSIPALARQSHLLGLNLGAPVRALGVVGWLGAGLALSLAGVALGTAGATVVALVASWGKNRRALEVVERAREAAQRSGRLFGEGSPSGGPALHAGRQTNQYARPSTPAGAYDAAPEYFGGSVPPAQQNADMREALAAWAETQDGQHRPPARKTPPSTPPKGPDHDNWLC